MKTKTMITRAFFRGINLAAKMRKKRRRMSIIEGREGSSSRITGLQRRRRRKRKRMRRSQS